MFVISLLSSIPLRGYAAFIHMRFLQVGASIKSIAMGALVFGGTHGCLHLNFKTMVTFGAFSQVK